MKLSEESNGNGKSDHASIPRQPFQSLRKNCSWRFSQTDIVSSLTLRSSSFMVASTSLLRANGRSFRPKERV
jgi:hypothetical protein